MVCACSKVRVLRIGNPDYVSDYCKCFMLPCTCLYLTAEERSVFNQDEDGIGNILMSSAFSTEENEQLTLPLKESTLFISASCGVFLYCRISQQGRSCRAEKPCKEIAPGESLIEEKVIGC